MGRDVQYHYDDDGAALERGASLVSVSATWMECSNMYHMFFQLMTLHTVCAWSARHALPQLMHKPNSC